MSKCSDFGGCALGAGASVAGCLVECVFMAFAVLVGMFIINIVMSLFGS